MSINFIVFAFCIAFSIVAFMTVIGFATRNNHQPRKPPIMPKTPTRETLYSDHVIHVASRIYCNYNESKIIRPGANNQPKKDRYGEALQEALNLVGATYRYFDMMDSEKPEVIKKADLKNIKIN